MLRSVQRKMLLRVACAYRTVSAAAVQVVTGTLPINLLIEERREMAIGPEERTLTKKQIRDRFIQSWQDEWTANVAVATWTREIIPNIKDWVKCVHKTLTYETTQVLTGHGCFKKYTHKIGKENTPNCVYCDEEVEDTPEHTIMVCRRWERDREEMYARINYRARSTKELVARMIVDATVWREGTAFFKKTITTKEGEERRRQELERAGGEDE